MHEETNEKRKWLGVTDELLLNALVEEDKMRRSEEGQLRFQEAEQQDDHDWMEEASIMQLEALEKVGIEPSQHNLALMRAAALKHPEIALYVKNNICRDGTICRVGEVAPSCMLRDLEQRQVAWPPSDMKEGVPVVAIAGSVS